MRKVATILWLPFLFAAALSLSACQSATSTEETLKVDDFVDATVTPNPATAAACTDGKTYRVVRGNNQPDDILLYDWCSTFAVTLTLNKNATDKDVNLSFPVEITSATVKVEQASGGIVSPPTGGDTEHYDSVLLSSTASEITAVGGATTMSFYVWYDLPSLRKEARITVTISFKDDDDVTFAKTVKVNVAP
jgi:hypothetical protein